MTRSATTPWATSELGFELVDSGSSISATVPELVLPGLRRNPKRAHLLVSTVLGKHIPTPPDAVIGAGNALGDLVVDALGPDVGDVVVLGFAETATGLGHCVAARIGAQCYLHSTRRAVADASVHAAFEEGHSHATSHLLMPTSPDLFANDHPLVLVDDEISTGATAIDAIRSLHAHDRRSRYVVASLVDMRTERHREATAAAADELGTVIEFVSLATGHAVLPDGLTNAVAELPDPVLNPRAEVRGTISRVELSWPSTVPDGGRHGFLRSDSDAFDHAIDSAAVELAKHLPARPLVVVGHEELMYLPLRLADALSKSGHDVTFQTTTRSPAYVRDVPGYPLRRGFRFTAPELDPDAPRFLYNAHTSEVDPLIVVVIDEPADTPALTADGGLVDVLTASGADVVVAVVTGADVVALHDSRRIAQ